MSAEADFEAHRSHLFGVAYRMLGSRAEAEDAVQEAWLRYDAARPQADDLRAWLTTVVARICLDVLRSARVRREAYVGSWLPEPLVTRYPEPGAGRASGGRSSSGRSSAAGSPPVADPAADPATVAVGREQVSLALLVVLERLTPEQRVAFILHDVFAVPFEEIASTLGTSAANARQHASRARRAVAGAEPVQRPSDLAEQRRVLAAFLAAADRGDLAGLARVLAPDVVLIGDGGGLVPSLRRPLQGIEQVSRFLAGLLGQAGLRGARAEVVLVNGDLGLVVEAGRNLALVAPVVTGGRVVAVYNVLNPEKLRDLPRPDPATATWPPIFPPQ